MSRTTLEWKPDKRNGGSPLGAVYKNGKWDGYMGYGEALSYAGRLGTKLKITGPLSGYVRQVKRQERAAARAAEKRNRP